MFIDLYKKQIIVWIMLLFLIISFSIYFINKDRNIVENIKVTVNTWSVTFNDSDITWLNNYDYYQVYMYPNKYNVICNSKTDWICDKILSKKNLIGSYVLAYFWKDLKKWEIWEVDLKTYFTDEQSNKNMLKEIFINLYTPTQNTQKTWYEKYFDFKKQNMQEGEEVILNDMEKMCVENIINSIPAWSYDMENEIKNRVSNDCKMFWNMTPIDMAFWWIKQDDNQEVEFGIDISEVRLWYKFFIKKGLDFEELKNDTKIIPKNIKILDNIKLNELIVR